MEDHIYIIMAKVLQEEATEAERAELDTWLAANPSNIAIYTQMKEVWGRADVLAETPVFDTGAAWSKVSQRLHIEAAPAKAEKRGKVLPFPSWLRYSSAIAAILVIALLVWNPFAKDELRITALERNMSITLPDGSLITLHKGSSLTYPKQFKHNERRVALQGEAFFDVTRNEQQPFVVDAQPVTVKVLGTSFDVHCNAEKADVSVVTGKVQVSSNARNNTPVVLTPGKKVHYEDGKLSPALTNGYESSWKLDTLRFNGAPLSSVLAAISAAKDTTVSADVSLTPLELHQSITILLPASQPLEEMLTELCLIADIRWERRGALYLVRRK